MASIRKLPSGKWNVQIRKRGHAPISKTFTTKTDATKWLRLTEAELEQGLFIDRAEAQSTTLADALTRYRDEVTPSKKGASQKKQRINKWLQHPYAKRSLASLKPSDFASYRDQRLAEVASNTVRLELALVSHLFNVASKEWDIQGMRNPIASIRKPRPSNARSRRLSTPEMCRLLESCKQSDNQMLLPLVELALETAMRLGEMLSMTWGQVSVENRTISLFDTKNGEDRTIPLSSRAIAILQSITPDKNCSRVFHLWRRSDSIKGSWKTALRRAGIVDFHFHDLRHEATSRFFELGLNPIEVAAITGHKSMQMLKRYTHPRIADLAGKLDAPAPKID